MLHIENQITVCLEDGNLKINADEKNALDSCFSEDHIKVFYILNGTDIKVKPGSNNITEENIKDKEKFEFKIEIDGQTERFDRNNTESCAKLVQIQSVGSKHQKSNTSLVIIGIVIGTVMALVVAAAIIFAVIRRRRMKKKNMKREDDNPTYGEYFYEEEEAVVTDQNPEYDI